MKKIHSMNYIYNVYKGDFDLDPLIERNLSTGDDWQVYHQIKMEMIERQAVDTWLVKNQFEFAIMLEAYRINYLNYMNKYQFPLLIEFHEVVTGIGTCGFTFSVC